jgi:hypothetical protein
MVDNSNVDWGQGLKQLRAYLQTHRIEDYATVILERRPTPWITGSALQHGFFCSSHARASHPEVNVFRVAGIFLQYLEKPQLQSSKPVTTIDIYYVIRSIELLHGAF